LSYERTMLSLTYNNLAERETVIYTLITKRAFSHMLHEYLKIRIRAGNPNPFNVYESWLRRHAFFNLKSLGLNLREAQRLIS